MNLFNNITTSRWQGQTREGLSGGSLKAKLRVHGQKRHIRPGFRGELAQDNETHGIANQGKWRDCATKVCTLIWGGLNNRREVIQVINSRWETGETYPGCISSPSTDTSETDGTHLRNSSGFMGDHKIVCLEVSRGHSSQGVGVMAGAWRRTEHFTRGSLSYLGDFSGDGRSNHS